MLEVSILCYCFLFSFNVIMTEFLEFKQKGKKRRFGIFSFLKLFSFGLSGQSIVFKGGGGGMYKNYIKQLSSESPLLLLFILSKIHPMSYVLAIKIMSPIKSFITSLFVCGFHITPSFTASPSSPIFQIFSHFLYLASLFHFHSSFMILKVVNFVFSPMFLLFQIVLYYLAPICHSWSVIILFISSPKHK